LSSSNLQKSTPTRTHHSNYNGPESALAIFRYEFTTLPRRILITTFTLKDHPMDWPCAMQTLIFPQVVEFVRVSIEAISEGETSAAKLLLSIFWSRVMKDENIGDYFIFWTFLEHPSHN
jgi:hypothetical protein